MSNNLNIWPLWAAVTVAVCLFSVGAQGRPATYGEDFVRLGADWPEGGSRWQAMMGQQTQLEDVEPYRQQFENLELRDGPYADALAEPLASMGRYYRQQGDYEQAAALYSRAMHVVRVNDGLYSERQIPLLRELLVSYREAGDMEALDERYAYFFRLYGNGKPPFSDLRIRAALEFMRWQREAVRLDLEGGKRRMVALVDLNEDVIEAIETDVDARYQWRRDLTYSQLLNLYLLQSRFSEKLQQTDIVSSREYVSPKPMMEDLQDQQLEMKLRGLKGEGARLLEALLPAARQQGPREEAAVQLALADWFFWNSSRQSSNQAYAEVVRILTGAGEDELLHTWLAEPVELPDNGVFWQPSADSVSGAVVRASYDVSNRGRPTNLEVEIIEGGDETRLTRFRRRLAATLFRPRWMSGEAEAVSGISREYQLLD